MMRVVRCPILSILWLLAALPVALMVIMPE